MALVCQGKARVEVVLFLAVDCPIANRYVPELRELAKEFREAEWRGVFTTEAGRIAKWEAEFAPGFAVARDEGKRERKRAGATRTPEAAVYWDGRLVYRGRIDDRYVSWGKSRTEATRRELRMVLEALRRGEKPAVPWAKAVGCFLEN
jgi:hypothetical protein